MKTIKIAAIQMCAELGAVDRNLQAADALVTEAFRQGAQWVILPEFFTSAMAFHPSMHNAWVPLDGPVLAMMRRLARQFDGVVGGSFIARSGNDCLNSFVLVFPDGRYWRHDKDLPTMWENCYYTGGRDEGVLDTPQGAVGVALCWEFIRSQTARRLKHRVGIVVGGTCWWDFPMPVPKRHQADQDRLIGIQRQAPVHLAQMLGVPVVHASHAGSFVAETPGKPETLYTSRYLGETQIVSAQGEVLARMAPEDGEGIVHAQVSLESTETLGRPIPDGFWTCDLPTGVLTVWEQQNTWGRDYYQSITRPGLLDPS